MSPDLFLFAPPANFSATLVFCIFGLLVGSFLNVVIHRLPRMMQRESDNYVAQESGQPLPHTDTFNLMVPRSRCPQCGHQITAIENIPVLSYLVLRGKCSACQAPISARYPIIEALTSLLSAIVVWQLGTGIVGLSALVLTWF